jgi:hypothetical protein
MFLRLSLMHAVASAFTGTIHLRPIHQNDESRSSTGTTMGCHLISDTVGVVSISNFKAIVKSQISKPVYQDDRSKLPMQWYS